MSFRNKQKFGWHSHIETLEFDNGEEVNSKVFANLFYGHTILRPSCYECPYKSIMHPGDITIADYWGIENVVPDFDDNRGVSLVMINNKNGEKIFGAVKCSIEWRQTRIEDSMQPPLKYSFPEPSNRQQFWRDFSEKKFDYIAKKYGGVGFINAVNKKMNNIKYKLSNIFKEWYK